MSSDLSTYLGNKIVRWLCGQAMPSAPSSIYTALFHGNPKSGGTEVTTDVNSSGRIAMPVTAPASGTTNTVSSDSDVDYGNSENDVTIDWVAIFDAGSSGNLLSAKAIATQTVATGEPVKFLAGNLTFTIGS